MFHFRQLPRPYAWGNEAQNDIDFGNVRRVFERFISEGAGRESAAATWTPRVDIREEAGRFVILVDVPGVDPKEIEVRMDENVLSIKGERKPESAQDGERWSRRESPRGSFERSFTLPETVDADAIQASGRNGVLEIVIPRKAQAKARRIEVN